MPKTAPIRLTYRDLKRARHALGLTQQRLADQLGLSRGFIGHVEANIHPMQPQLALAVECLLRRAGCWPLPGDTER